MPFVEVGTLVIADTVRKRLGKPNFFGWIMFGWSEFGDNNYCSGVYQQRRNRQYDYTKMKWKFGRPRNFIMKPAWPVQPPSVARDAQQAKFSTALSMWQALTAEQKKYYNSIANRRSRRGYDYFMSKTLKSL